MTDTLILTGWGWKEYAVAAAVALKAHHGDADVRGVSKRRLPELLEDLLSDACCHSCHLCTYKGMRDVW